MIQIGRDDLLRALKGFKGLAKQELLINGELTEEKLAQKTHALARRETYLQLIEKLESSGTEATCVFAFDEYHKFSEDEHPTDPVNDGHQQALEMFFQLLGIQPTQLRNSIQNKLPFEEVLALNTPQTSYYV